MSRTSMTEQPDRLVEASPPLSGRPRPRRHDLDWMRVLAMLGVFLFHNARFFDDLDWHVKNAQHSVIAFAFVGFMDAWQMPLLMLLAGAGSWFALDYRTPGRYLLERVTRLLVPLYTVGLFLLIPPQFYWDQLTRGRFEGTFSEFYPIFLAGIELRPGVRFLSFWSGHLWFLRSLFLCSLLALPAMLFLKSARGGRFIDRVAGLCARPGGLILVVIPAWAMQAALRPLWPPGDHGSAEFLYLLAFFLTGAVLVADERFNMAVRRHGRACLALGIIFFSTMAGWVLAGGYVGWQAPDYSLRCISFFSLASMNTWCWLVFLLSVASRHLDKNSNRLAHLNEAVLPFYVLHQTVILGVGRLVVRWDAGIPAKYTVIAAVSLAIIVAVYELLVRPFNVPRILFGMRPLRKSGDGRPCSTDFGLRARRR